jgi:catechol 2,3-dioxygenase
LSEVGVAAPSYRLPPELRLGGVLLQVADLGRSVGYYESVLGLSTKESAGGRAALGPVDGDGVLLELMERPGADPVPRGGRLGLYHFAILLPDRRALGRFAAHLSLLGIGPGAADHHVSEALYLTDPDGLGIEVYADRPREAWLHRGRELVMTTEALDLGALAAAAGGEPWAGAPGGTVIGHVHLHVGDLEAASAFYHDALGLDVTVWSYPGALFLSAGGYHHHLGLNTWSRGGPADDDHARLLEWRIVLPAEADVDAVAASLEAAGRAVRRDGGGVTADDPWGTTLRVST